MKQVIIKSTYLLGYSYNVRNRKISVSAEIKGTRKELTIPVIHFISVFPILSNQYEHGEVEATLDNLLALGYKFPTWETFTMQARYVYVPAPLDRYTVNLLGTNQTISSAVSYFQKITGVSDRAVLGSVPLTVEQAIELGFLVPRGGVSNVDIQSELSYAFA